MVCGGRKGLQSGNIMLALFAAIGAVGVVGATSMNVMKGPVRGMHQVTQKTIAENNMIASIKLAVMAASQQPNSGDCDGDNTVEPIAWSNSGTGPRPAGGGYLPANIGASLQDPWGNTYGYCVWDHGSAIQTTCPTPTQRLRGAGVGGSGPVIAIISSGPDRTFQTSCANAPTYINKVSGSDDIVLSYTYAEASSLSGGVWNLKPSDLNTAEINKNLEVKNAANNVVFGVDSTSDINRPSIKVDYIKSLTQPRVEMLSALTVASDIVASQSSDTGPRLRLVNPAKTGANVSDWSIWNMTGAYGNGLAFWRYLANGTNGGASMWLADNGSVGINVGTSQPSQTLDVNGTMTATIMYDKNDGGYYVDPNGTSRLATLYPNWINCMNGHCPANGVVRMTPNLHLNSGPGNAVIMNWDNGTTGGSQSLRVGNGGGADAFYVNANGAFYGGLFYDINDASYYVDPNGTSRMNALNVMGAIGSSVGTIRDAGGGWVRTYGNTGWYSQTYGGGWWMTDTSWIRAYGDKNVYTPGQMQAGSLNAPTTYTNTICNTGGGNCVSQGAIAAAASGGGGGTQRHIVTVNASGYKSDGDSNPTCSASAACPSGWFIVGCAGTGGWGGTCQIIPESNTAYHSSSTYSCTIKAICLK